MNDLITKSIRAIRYLFYRHLDINEQIELVEHLNKSIEKCVKNYAKDVKMKRFPFIKNVYK